MLEKGKSPNICELVCTVQLKTDSFQAFVLLIHFAVFVHGLVFAFAGLLMILDTLQERGLALADIRWGDEEQCRFPLFDSMRPLPLQWMVMLYLCMSIGMVHMPLSQNSAHSAQNPVYNTHTLFHSPCSHNKVEGGGGMLEPLVLVSLSKVCLDVF